MDISIDTLFAEREFAEDAVVGALDHRDIVVGLSSALARERVAVLRNDSFSIGVHLYYAGLVGEAAELKLDAHAHGRDLHRGNRSLRQ